MAKETKTKADEMLEEAFDIDFTLDADEENEEFQLKGNYKGDKARAKTSFKTVGILGKILGAAIFGTKKESK